MNFLFCLIASFKICHIVKVREVDSNEKSYFNFKNWIDKEHGFEHEIAASNEQGVPSLSSVTYQVSTVTGNCRGAGYENSYFFWFLNNLQKKKN